MQTYTYHGIRYEYGDLQQARRRQNALFHAALEKEDYNEASRISDTDPREFLPQIAEQQTGDKRTLTAPTKCGIIKAIVRHVRRWKQKQEGKTMRKLKVYLKTPYAFAVEIDGKEVYATGKAKDIANYCERHFGVKIPTETRNYPTGAKTHFDGLTKNGFEFEIE